MFPFRSPLSGLTMMFAPIPGAFAPGYWRSAPPGLHRRGFILRWDRRSFRLKCHAPISMGVVRQSIATCRLCRIIRAADGPQ